MYNIKPELRLSIVQHYLKNKESMRKTAQRFNVNYRTVFKWVKLYKEKGEKRLFPTYKNPWGRTKNEIEEKVAFLKEKDPGLTVRKARRTLEKEGIEISLKAIWRIWKRYGYTGFKKEKFAGDFRRYICIPSEVKEEIKQAKLKIEQGKLKEAARILNELPFCGDAEILMQVSDRLLSPKRILEKLPALFGKIPLPVYLRKTRNLKKTLFKMRYKYSGIRAAMEEIRVLAWLGRYEEEIYFIEKTEKMMKKNKKTLMPLPLLTCILKGIAHTLFLQIDRAILCLKECKKLSHYIKSPRLLVELANFYSQLAFYTEAESLIQRALKYAPKEDRATINIYPVDILIRRGDYKGCLEFLKEKILKPEGAYRVFVLLFRAQIYLGLGQIEKANEETRKAFLVSRKMGTLHYIRIASYLMASIHSAFGEEKKAKNILKRYRKFLIKHKMNMDLIMWEIILGNKALPRGIEKHRVVRLALLLRKSVESKKERDFRKAYLFAERHGLLGTFHRLCLLMPEAVRISIKKGKSTGLPKAILRLPVFNKEVPVYNIKFLGDLIVYKNQRGFSNGVKLPPKDAAFLIHLALKAGEPGKKIFLKDLCNNYWQDSENFSRNLSHLLVRIKKTLRIPAHLLEVSYRKDILVNKGIYFTSDYGEFEQILIHAKALHRAGEWGFARKEYLRAFKLFRGESFRKMYDRWSENMRRVISNQLETEAINFAKSCLEHKNKKDAKKVLHNVLRIIHYSNEIKKLLENL